MTRITIICFAMLLAVRLPDSARVAESISRVSGRFQIGRLPEGEYYLRLGSLGYATVMTEAFELAYAETRDRAGRG